MSKIKCKIPSELRSVANKLVDKGYKVKKSQIDINLDYEEKEYGTIRKIYICHIVENGCLDKMFT